MGDTCIENGIWVVLVVLVVVPFPLQPGSSGIKDVNAKRTNKAQALNTILVVFITILP
jgi:hypothetical protein